MTTRDERPSGPIKTAEDFERMRAWAIRETESAFATFEAMVAHRQRAITGTTDRGRIAELADEIAQLERMKAEVITAATDLGDPVVTEMVQRLTAAVAN